MCDSYMYEETVVIVTLCRHSKSSHVVLTVNNDFCFDKNGVDITRDVDLERKHCQSSLKSL